MTFSLLVAATVLLALAGYAQTRIPALTAGRSKALLTRLVLALVGAALGYVAVASYPVQGTDAVLTFLAGFGVVHVPAAIILFLKRRRGENKS